MGEGEWVGGWTSEGTRKGRKREKLKYPRGPEKRAVSDDSESQGVEEGGGAAASELLAIYGSPF